MFTMFKVLAYFLRQNPSTVHREPDPTFYNLRGQPSCLRRGHCYGNLYTMQAKRQLRASTWQNTNETEAEWKKKLYVGSVPIESECEIILECLSKVSLFSHVVFAKHLHAFMGTMYRRMIQSHLLEKELVRLTERLFNSLCSLAETNSMRNIVWGWGLIPCHREPDRGPVHLNEIVDPEC